MFLTADSVVAPLWIDLHGGIPLPLRNKNGVMSCDNTLARQPNAGRGQFLILHWTPIVHRMARPLRLEFPGALYHLTARGNVQQAIFVDDWDRQHFLRLLGREVRQ